MKEMLSGELIIIYEGRGQGDSDHGNAPWFTVGWYLTEAEATEAVKTSGGWGTPGDVRTATALKTDGELEFYYKLVPIEVTSIDIKKAQEKIREQALAKLTPLEKKALGL
jgi:hypothetical protein